MKGQQVLKHPDREEITRMLNEGYTTDEVCRWLKQKHKHIMYHLSAITLQYYRNNFLKLEKEEIAKRRKDLVSSGNVKDIHVLDSFSASQGFIEAKEKASAELINALENFREIQDKVKDRLNLIERETRDADGKQIYKARNEEIIQGYLTRLESMTNSFVKMQEYLAKKNEPAAGGSTEIQITMNEMNKYSDLFKNVMQRTMTKIDPSLLNEFYAIFNEERNKLMAEQGMTEPGSKVNISINNSDTKVKIVTNSPDGDMPASINVTQNQAPQNRDEYIDLDDEEVAETPPLPE
jgi:hypothetical protein